MGLREAREQAPRWQPQPQPAPWRGPVSDPGVCTEPRAKPREVWVTARLNASLLPAGGECLRPALARGARQLCSVVENGGQVGIRTGQAEDKNI